MCQGSEGQGHSQAITSSDLLRAYRRRSGLSQQEFAKKTGLSYGSIKKYELNERSIPTDLSLRIALALHDIDLLATTLQSFLTASKWKASEINLLNQRLI